MIFDHQYADAALTIEVTKQAPVTVTVAGEIDRDNCAQLERVVTALLLADRPRRVALDMAQVTFMGSDGIRVLLTCRRRAEQVSSRIAIVRAHQCVRQVLTITNLQDVLNMSAEGDSEV